MIALPDPKPIKLRTGVTLDVCEAGLQDAPALIFLHGFPESWRTWRHQIAHFATHYRCIAPDQRGYGASSKPASVEDYAPEKLAGDVLALADALGIERFTLIGHDWGGMVAWLVAHIAPDRVSRLAIANAPHPSLFQQLLCTDAAQREASAYITALRDPAIDEDLAARGLAPTLLRLFGKGALAAMEPEERAHLLTRWQDGEAARAMVNWYRASPIVVPPGDAPSLTPLPAALPMPVQVIWGMEDRDLLPACLDGLEEVCPDLRIARLPGVGHFSPWAAAEKVNEVLEGFLKEE
ncbi:alpha/beta fold hydrolase [Novosphingobium terrae]|uniref:alpha/beta fold hydrolase n=1 Tax=Novosphingobium terrae TaxID=2726189 RepID=UPI00197CD6A7|nr:alpha/beta hydrolase [Novosphingobium terrae]